MQRCSKCKELDAKKRSAGKVNGAVYFCKKNKCFVKGNSEGCDKYKDAKRKYADEEKIYIDGRKYDDIQISVFALFIIFLLLVFVGLITGVFS